MKKIIMMMFALMAIMTGAGAQDVYYPQIPVEIEVYSTTSLMLLMQICNTFLFDRQSWSVVRFPFRWLKYSGCDLK